MFTGIKLINAECVLMLILLGENEHRHTSSSDRTVPTWRFFMVPVLLLLLFFRWFV